MHLTLITLSIALHSRRFWTMYSNRHNHDTDVTVKRNLERILSTSITKLPPLQVSRPRLKSTKRTSIVESCTTGSDRTDTDSGGRGQT